MKIPVGKSLLDCFVIAMAGGVIVTALRWPFKTALFPAAIAFPVFLMAVIDLLWNLFGKQKKDARGPPAISNSRKVSTRQWRFGEPSSMFAWVLGFFLLILLVGFPIAIPLFFILFLKLQGKEGWTMSIGLAAVAWLSFYGLFVWLSEHSFRRGMDPKDVLTLNLSTGGIKRWRSMQTCGHT